MGKILRKLAVLIGGHFNLGHLTIFGDNAMHFGCTYWTKRYGYICFQLPIPCGIADKFRWQPLYLYLSPNATPWCATYVLGSRFDFKDKIKAKYRKKLLGHNFQYDSEKEDLNYRTLMMINGGKYNE